ncbi:MAG TPA: hypothetical protein VF763_09205 [Candidatus Limnocylindrales bacterium]
MAPASRAPSRPAPTGDRRPALVLDVGGVLLVDPMPTLFARLAQAGERPRAALLAFYRAQLRQGFWDGTLAEDEFWSRLLCAAGLSSTDARAWRDEVLAWQTPLPAVERLTAWAASARILLLSNHRSAWIRPRLAAAGVVLPASGATGDGPIERALVSEETGLVKPDDVAFEAALAVAGPGTRCLFADDQPPNVARARAVGLPAVLVEPDGRWMAEVDAWLAGEGVGLSGGPAVPADEATLEP